MRTTFKLSLAKPCVIMFGLLLMAVTACKKDVTPKTAPGNESAKLRTDAIGVNGPKGVCYVEVNNNDIRNVGNYKLSSGEQLFDIAIIFAANINYNTSTQKAQLFFNTQVTNVLNNKATYIQSLQAKGIKVLLSILGNHQGAGISNFPSQAAAQDFAQQLSNAVTTYGLDGIDFDDEYADYGTNGTGQPNSSSFVYLVTALRQLMPNKIISFYYYGPAASRLSYNGVTVGSKVDYSWNAVYGTYSAPNVPGLAKSNLGPAAIDIQSTGASTAASLATQTVNNSYGIYLYYNLPNTDVHTYLSGVSNALYGKATVYNAGTTTPTTITNGGIYKIVSALNNSSVIDCNSSAPVNGTAVTLWADNGGGNNQKWLARSAGNGYFTFKSLADTTKVLDVQSGSSTAGTLIQMYTANGTAAQKFLPTDAGSGYFSLSPGNATTLLLDVNNASTANGTSIKIWNPNGNSAQKFKLVQQ